MTRRDFNILFSIDLHSYTRRSLVYPGSILDLLTLLCGLAIRYALVRGSGTIQIR
jgi:hypothetical protein